MKKVEIKDNGIFVDGKYVPMVSGEFHYWRTPPDAWEKVFASMKELGFSMVATYIPWDFHEIKKGSYDFSGKTSEHKNLVCWLELADKKGFKVIIRPGPYIYAEWNLGGPPDYAFKYPKYSEEFLELAEVWIKNISHALKPFLATKGGPIILLQACNETVGHYEYANFDDPKYKKIEGIYKQYIKERFPKIKDFNEAADKNYKDFSKVELPQIKAGWGGCNLREIDLGTLPASLNECKILIDFGKWYTEAYLKEIYNLYKKQGIDVPIFANLVGWYWPQNWERLKKVVDLVSMDTYYQNLLPGDLYAAFTKLYKLFAGTSKFPTAVEFQCGVWDPMVKITGVMSERHFYFTTMVAFACGLKGISYYMLVNRDNWYFAPINEWGKIRNDAVKVVNRTTETLEKLSFENLRRTTKIAVAWYAPHTEHFLFTGKKQVHLEFRHKDISRMPFAEDYPQGWDLYRSLTRAGIDCDVISLTGEREWPEFLVYGGYPFMEWPLAEKLYKYVCAGGKLIVYGALPEVDITGHAHYDLFKDLLKYQRTCRAKGVFSIKCGRGAIYFGPENQTNHREFLKEVGYAEPVHSEVPGVYTSIHLNTKTKKQVVFITNNNFERTEVKLTVERGCKHQNLVDIVDNKKYPLRGQLTIDKKDVRVFYLT
jgi:beta-galactosidase